MTYYGRCEYCHTPVSGEPGNPDGPTFPVTGWEILRVGGGANQIHGRERVPDVVRHVRCLPTKVQSELQGRLI